MQLSTRSEDVVVDVLALRPHIGRVLAPIFADPGVVKVLHGSDGDIVWLQRDFGLFPVTMFDTGQAARVLEYPSFGLAHLLHHFCGFKVRSRAAPGQGWAAVLVCVFLVCNVSVWPSRATRQL